MSRRHYTFSNWPRQLVVTVWMSAGRKSGGALLGLRLNPQFQWFVRQVRPFLQAHLLSVSMIVLSSLMFLLDPLIIKWLIDRILPRKDAHYSSQ